MLLAHLAHKSLSVNQPCRGTSKTLIAVVASCLLVGCAGNAISLLEYRGSVTLIDSGGTFFSGKTQFHLGRQNGTLSIPKTSYGDLTGQFIVNPKVITRSGSGVGMAMASSGTTLIAPSFSSETVSFPGNNSTVYLKRDNKLVIECVAEVSMRTPGYPVAYMTGNGVCLDGEGRKLRIIFSEEEGQ